MCICVFANLFICFLLRKYSFERLEVWQLSRKLVQQIYLVTQDFSDSEKFGIVIQIRRASISVSNNIVEGSSRRSTKDKKRFIEIAYGSLLEVLNLLILSNDLDLISTNKLTEYRDLIEELSNKLNALRNSIR